MAQAVHDKRRNRVPSGKSPDLNVRTTMSRTPRTLKRVQGITYWVLNDPREIDRYINSNVRCEWVRDNLEDGVDSRKDEWLLSLSRRTWRLKILKMEKVRLDPSTMNKEGFAARLNKRSDELVRCISRFHTVIWPVVVRGENLELRDGYCRFSALRKMKIGKLMTYTGFLKNSS